MAAKQGVRGGQLWNDRPARRTVMEGTDGPGRPVANSHSRGRWFRSSIAHQENRRSEAKWPPDPFHVPPNSGPPCVPIACQTPRASARRAIEHSLQPARCCAADRPPRLGQPVGGDHCLDPCPYARRVCAKVTLVVLVADRLFRPAYGSPKLPENQVKDAGVFWMELPCAVHDILL